MIRRLRPFKLSPAAFLTSLPDFWGHYIRSRPRHSLLLGIPSAAVTLAILLALRQGETGSGKAALKERYVQLSQMALRENDLVTAETYFTRVLSMSLDPVAASFEFAEQLYTIADGPQHVEFFLPPVRPVSENVAPMLSRAVTLMQSLAPRRSHAGGYAPAHQFLADFWNSRRPQSEIVRTLALQHAMYAAPSDRKPALRLARYIAERSYHQQAIEVLQPFQDDNPDVMLQMAAAYASLNDVRSASRLLDTAEQKLTQRLHNDANDFAVREQLSRALAAQGRMLESMFLLAEGCRENASPRLIDGLIQRYTAWLAMMKPENAVRQLDDISLALQYSSSWDADYASSSRHVLTQSSGRQTTLPGPIVAFHQALLNGDGAWLIPLLLGTDAAAKSDFQRARALLDASLTAAPNHPVTANNLAWTLLQIHAGSPVSREVGNMTEPTSKSNPSDKDDDPQNRPSSVDYVRSTDATAALTRAWQLSCLSVERCPENVSFRETRGLVAAATDRCQVASDDLQTCRAAGHYSPMLRRYVAAALQRQSSTTRLPATGSE